MLYENQQQFEKLLLNFDPWPITVTLTFDIVFGFHHEMPSHQYEHFYQVIRN